MCSKWVAHGQIGLLQIEFEPRQNKTYNKACATSEDADQSAHLHVKIQINCSDSFQQGLTFLMLNTTCL